jgi:acyl-CoA thioester hydrolase
MISGVPRFVCQVPVRWGDMDAYGHVNNVEQLRLLEEARVALFFTGGRTAGVSTFDGQLVVARHTIEYKRPLHYRPEPLTLQVWVTKLAASSVTIAYEIRDDDALYATASSVLAAFDADGSHVRRLTEAERAYLEKFRAD